jgi:GNAT superfamily N-acetyltransferase
MDVSVREVTATGHAALALATDLLQRARRADPQAGLWEAADVQWWWRTPRPSDDVEKLFWIDDEGPVAGVLLTGSTGNDAWECNLILVPGTPGPEPEVVWHRALEHATLHCPDGFEVPLADDDRVFTELAGRSGLTAGYRDSTAWMAAADRPAVLVPADGFVVVDRTQRQDTAHHLRDRAGDGVAERLAECSLYDPKLDLSVVTADGRVAGYSLYWFDPTTRVGLVEPVRVEDQFQRQGLARAMLSDGIDRLATRGAQRVKISYGSDAAGAVYTGMGFRPTSSTTWYRR